MTTPDREGFPRPWACQGPIDTHVEKARRVLSQELRHATLAEDPLTPDFLASVGDQALASIGDPAQFFKTRTASLPGAVETAQDAIWHLFDDGLIDDSSATVALLAIYVGLRRSAARRHRA